MTNVYGTFNGVTIYRQSLEHSGTNLSQCHIFLYKSHVVCLGLQLGSPRIEVYGTSYALWLLYLPYVLTFNIGFNLAHYAISLVRTCSLCCRFFCPDISMREANCLVPEPSPAQPERNPILVQTNTCRDYQIAFHYTCGKLSGPVLSTKWLLKHNSPSVPFSVGNISAMFLYKYAV